VCVTGASNFLGTKPPLHIVRAIARASGYVQPDGRTGSLLLVDAAQLVPSGSVDVQALDVDYLAFSFHKLLAPFGVGVLYAKEHLLDNALPFLYGGDMIAEGRVAPDLVDYNVLPWKYTAGTPNVLGVIASAQALRLVLDLVSGERRWFATSLPMPRPAIKSAMNLVARHIRSVTERALEAAQSPRELPAEFHPLHEHRRHRACHGRTAPCCRRTMRPGRCISSGGHKPAALNLPGQHRFVPEAGRVVRTNRP
jgi:cysteine desulfurase/selenocysteine lyase